MKNIIVIGGGAAGMTAALSASENGAHVTICEKNEKLGKKLFITGKGRCNLTNASDMKTVMEHVISNPRFLYSAFRTFSNTDMMELIENAGCPLKTERGNRVFPVSDHSSDIIKALEYELKKHHVKTELNTQVEKLNVVDSRCNGVVLKDGTVLSADAVIIAAGGLSYPSTGSDGDGMKFASQTGHRVTALYPSLVPFIVKEQECRDLQGLSLKNISISIVNDGKELYSAFGEMMFTHFGVSGPVLLSASSYAAKLLREKELELYIDLKPALSSEQLDARILRDFGDEQNKELKNALSALFPSRLIPEVIRQSGISQEKKVHDITKEDRKSLIRATKELRYTLTGTRGYNEAVITKGGVDVRDVNPSTMESKLIKNLYFAGETLDLDALTGGYNLQIAWSTGWLAGKSAANE